MKRYRYVNFVFLLTIGIRFLAEAIPFGLFVNNLISLLVISQIILIIPSVVYLYTTKQNYRSAVGFNKLSVANIGLLFVFTLCVTPIMTLVNAFSRQYSVDATTNTMSNIATQNPFLVSLLCIAVIPAIFEESVYRGIFYQEYRKINPFGAIFFSALLFGMMHGNLNQFTYAFVMGIIMAIVIEATDSILSTMVIHFMTNGMSVILLYALPKLDENYEKLLEQASEVSKESFLSLMQAYGVRAFIGGVIGILVLLQIARNSNRLEHVKHIFRRKTKEERRACPPIRALLTLPLIIAIVMSMINIVFNELALRGLIRL